MDWDYSKPKPATLTEQKKSAIVKTVKAFIAGSPKLTGSINRFEVKAGRVYFYHLVEQFGWDRAGWEYDIPLIDGKFAEFIYARITVYPHGYTLDWQRPNNQWVTLFSGTLPECLKFLDERGEWFG
jgi:hypothetical protein